ncbi:MAG: hypothetical protein ACJAZH_000370 [Roseivirga sp.]|jgi:hypothetical protein
MVVLGKLLSPAYAAIIADFNLVIFQIFRNKDRQYATALFSLIWSISQPKRSIKVVSEAFF